LYSSLKKNKWESEQTNLLFQIELSMS
jgi:hypothetical protein